MLKRGQTKRDRPDDAKGIAHETRWQGAPDRYR